MIFLCISNQLQGKSFNLFVYCRHTQTALLLEEQQPQYGYQQANSKSIFPRRKINQPTILRIAFLSSRGISHG